MIQAQSAFSGFSVDSLGEAKRFYAQTLGLSVDENPMGLQLKLPSGGTVFIYPKDDHQPASFTILNLVVADIEATVDELIKSGVTFERYDNLPAAQDERGILRGRSANEGPDIAWFKDPAGNVLSILQE